MKNHFTTLAGTIVCCLIAMTYLLSFNATAQLSPAYKLLPGNSHIQSKNYYLLTLLQALPDVKLLIENDSALTSIARTKRLSLASAVNQCTTELSCYTTPLTLTPQEIRRVSQRLAELMKTEVALQKMVRDHLRKSGTYIRFDTGSDTELLTRAWEQDAAGINNTIRIYAQGGKPNYPQIDSIGFNVHKKSYPVLLHDCIDVLNQEKKDSTLFFSTPLHAVLLFLEINERTEAADYEPMITTVNKAAYDKVRKINWAKYKYSVILVPGGGPDTPERALSEGGIIRCRIAALRYFEGLAPFIVVSGGRVHPFKTKFSEAFEMKKFLIETLKVPESAIIMEPHARHTTTNIRNCARLIFRYGIPTDKPAVVSTVKSQSFYITNDAFVERCRKEIDHIPYRLGNRLDDTTFEFYPTLEALHIDADEPLDP